MYLDSIHQYFNYHSIYIFVQDLWKYKKWKYFINLTGQEFPLKTNLELVRILSSYNGANDIEAVLFRT